MPTRLIDVDSIDGTKAFLREHDTVKAETLHVLMLIAGEEHREALEQLVDELGITVEGEPGI